jgi:hypothetical protein
MRDRLDGTTLDQVVAQLRQRPVRERQPEVVRARECNGDDPLPRLLVDPPRPARRTNTIGNLQSETVAGRFEISQPVPASKQGLHSLKGH